MSDVAPTSEQIDAVAAQLADDPTYASHPYAYAYGALGGDIGALAFLHGSACVTCLRGVVCQERAVLSSALALIAAVGGEGTS